MSYKPPGSDKYYYTYVDENGRRRKCVGTSDKRTTDMIANEAKRRVELLRRGVIDPRAETLRRHNDRSLAEHLADWRAYVLAKGGTAKHADQSWTRAARVVALVRGLPIEAVDVPSAARERKERARKLLEETLATAKFSDLDADRVQLALDALRKRGRSTGCVNGHLRAIKGFSRWAWRIARRISEDPLAGLSLANEATDRRHVRRALVPGELARVIKAAEFGDVAEGMPGPERAMAYRVALGTGFRANELRCLTPESFRLDGDHPAIVVPAAYSKRRRDDVQPIRPELAATLRLWLASKPPGSLVFDQLPPLKTAAMLRVDLEAAGVPYRDGEGRVADFHSLRASYISGLVRGGASVKTAQTLARHSTPTLTIGLNAQTSRDEQKAALDGLPDV